jgi:hypothetical protein
LHQLGTIGRTLLCLTALAALAGCYNPRFPSESPSAASQESQQRRQQEAVRDRRDSAVGSGSSSPTR